MRFSAGGKFNRILGGDGGCGRCGYPLHEHDRERVYPDDGPPGSWHYRLTCPTGGSGVW